MTEGKHTEKPSPFGASVLPPRSTVSHWQRTVQGHPLATAGATGPLPEAADVVIIGSGLSGAVTAHSLLSAPTRPSSVVVLEAREICSGASGRNGGHCRPDAFRGFTSFSALHGEAQGKKILESEAITLANVARFVKENNVECELVLRPTVDVALTDEFAAYNADALARAHRAGMDVSHVEALPTAVVAERCAAPTAKAGFEWPAASVNPLKLAYGVYRACEALGGFSLHAYAPVTSVEPSDDAERPWAVCTPRGTVLARQVVHATNAYSPLLLPELDGLVTAFRAAAARLVPPPAKGFPPLAPTMSLRRGLHHFYSVAPQPDHSIVLSCSRTWAGQTAEEFEALWGCYDDSDAPWAQARDTAKAVARTIPDAGWDAERLGDGGVASHWTGIICWTPDAVPFVGPLPGKEGQFVIAGFNGHGMARIFHCAPCLADVMLGGMQAWDPSVPEVFQITPERLARLRDKVSREGDPNKTETTQQGAARL